MENKLRKGNEKRIVVYSRCAVGAVGVVFVVVCSIFY